jgi:outer membrane protein
MAAAMLMLAACGDDKKAAKEVTPPTVESVNPGSLKIAFYNMDSLTVNYSYLQEQDSAMKIKQSKFEANLMNRQRSMEALVKQMETAREKLTATPEEFARMERNLQMKQQDGQMYQQTEGMKLQKEAAEIQEAIARKMIEFSRLYCEKYNIDMLLVHGAGGQFGYIKPSMDVTKSFTEFVNAEQAKLNDAMGK